MRTSKTDLLVIGNATNPSWANGSYGNKIETAIIKRMAVGKPVIVPESYWKEILTREGSSGVAQT